MRENHKVLTGLLMMSLEEVAVRKNIEKDQKGGDEAYSV